MSSVILALDIADKRRALEIVEETKEYLHAVKIGWPVVLSAGMEIVDEVAKITEVICDFKVADIPNTTRLIVEQARRHGASGIIVHGFVGHDSLRAAIDAAGDMKVYVVAEMSHPGALDFMQPHTEGIIEMAKKEGAYGLIAPATRPERLRRIRELAGSMEILAPGVGVQGGKAREAIENGADYIIVGRSIYNSENPREAAKRLYQETL